MRARESSRGDALGQRGLAANHRDRVRRPARPPVHRRRRSCRSPPPAGRSRTNRSPSMHRDRAARTQGQTTAMPNCSCAYSTNAIGSTGRAPCSRVEASFVLVDDQHVETVEQRGGQARRRRGIQNHACPGPVRAHRQRLDFRHWNLELHEQRVSRRESMVRDAFGTRQRIGARHDGDRVFADDRRHGSARRPSPSTGVTPSSRTPAAARLASAADAK